MGHAARATPSGPATTVEKILAGQLVAGGRVTAFTDSDLRAGLKEIRVFETRNALAEHFDVIACRSPRFLLGTSEAPRFQIGELVIVHHPPHVARQRHFDENAAVLARGRITPGDIVLLERRDDRPGDQWATSDRVHQP